VIVRRDPARPRPKSSRARQVHEPLLREVERGLVHGVSVTAQVEVEEGRLRDEQESERALLETSRRLLDRLAVVTGRHARAWRERVGEIPPPHPSWYQAAP
jgi:hypothetical protein